MDHRKDVQTQRAAYMRNVPSWTLPPVGWRRYMHPSDSSSPADYTLDSSPGFNAGIDGEGNDSSTDDLDPDPYSSVLVPASSTPDLLYAASSSPGALSSLPEEGLQEGEMEDVAETVQDVTLAPLEDGDAYFAQRLHSLLEVAAEERRLTGSIKDGALQSSRPQQARYPSQRDLRPVSSGRLNASSLSPICVYPPDTMLQRQKRPTAVLTTLPVLPGASLATIGTSASLTHTSTTETVTSSAYMPSQARNNCSMKRIYSARDSRSLSYGSFDISSDDDDVSSLGSPWSQNGLSRIMSLTSSHPNKKAKFAVRTGTARYAREPAALRKARSLHSDTSFEGDKENATGHTLIPTIPNTRAPSPVSTRTHAAPPPVLLTFPFEQVPQVPFNADDAAERRLCLLLEKEEHDRTRSGFVTSALFARGIVLDPFRVSTRAMVEDDYASVQDEDEGSENEDEDDDEDDQDFGTAMGDELRANAIEWLLTVVPPVDDEPESPCQRKPRIYSEDLHDQLVENPDTRFFAAYLFARYFWTVSTPDDPSSVSSSGFVDNVRQEELVEGERRLVWDFAVAAVALSVKFHRDCLRPLAPVYARDFMAIAPHDMCFEDFELAQRDILDACAYELGTPTPQTFLDELHAALPTLRTLVGSDHGWTRVVDATWERLLRAVREPDVFRFPVSLLTAAALHEAIADFILEKVAEDETRAACGCECHARERRGCNEEDGDGDERETMQATRGVLEDIREVLGFSEVAMDVCKGWLVPLRNSEQLSGSMRSKYFNRVEKDDDMEMY